MDCEHVRQNLNGYIDAELPEEAVERIAFHLEMCHDCSRAVRRLQGLTTILQEVSAMEMPQDLTDRVLARARECCVGIRPMPRKEVSGVRRLIARFCTARMTTAAVLVMGLTIGSLMGRDTWRSQTVQYRGKTQIASAEPTAIYHVDYLTGTPKGSPAEAFLRLASATNVRDR